jgi:hypothetical protein
MAIAITFDAQPHAAPRHGHRAIAAKRGLYKLTEIPVGSLGGHPVPCGITVEDPLDRLALSFGGSNHFRNLS